MYRIIVSGKIRKQMLSLPKNVALRIDSAIINLEVNPFPSGVKKLIGYENQYRIRVGNYRILYEVQGNKLLIIVMKVAHRKDAYD